jgi:hypothetical protein
MLALVMRKICEVLWWHDTPSLVNVGSGVQMLLMGTLADAQSFTQEGDVLSLLSFCEGKRSRLKWIEAEDKRNIVLVLY